MFKILVALFLSSDGVSKVLLTTYYHYESTNDSRIFGVITVMAVGWKYGQNFLRVAEDKHYE